MKILSETVLKSCKCFHAELNCSAYLIRREFHRFHELWSSSAEQIIDSFAEKMEPDTCSVSCVIMGRSSKIQLRPFHRYYLLFVRNQKLRYQQNRTKFFFISLHNPYNFKPFDCDCIWCTFQEVGAAVKSANIPTPLTASTFFLSQSQSLFFFDQDGRQFQKSWQIQKRKWTTEIA